MVHANKVILAWTLIVACASQTALAGPPAIGDDWYLTFESEFEKPAGTPSDPDFKLEHFDAFAPDSDNAKWEYRAGPNKEAYAVEDNVLIAENKNGADSVLILRTSKETASDGDFTNPMRTGYIRTRNYQNTGPDDEMRFAQRYGYFEARMMLNTAPGQWGAFWLMPERSTWCADSSGRDGTEIDIVEGYPRNAGRPRNRNDSVNFAIHYDGYRSFHKKQVQSFPAVEQSRDFADFDASKFHTYGFLWTPDKYVWYINGQPVFEITDPKQISQVPKYLKLSTEVAAWSGKMDDSRFPADMVVDWVRVWQTDELAEGNPHIFEAEAASVERSNEVYTEWRTAGTWCKGVFARTTKEGEGKLSIPMTAPVETDQIGIRVSNMEDSSSALRLYIDGQEKAEWTAIDLDPIFILNHDFNAMIEKEIEIVWSGGIAIDQVYLIPKAMP